MPLALLHAHLFEAPDFFKKVVNVVYSWPIPVQM